MWCVYTMRWFELICQRWCIKIQSIDFYLMSWYAWMAVMTSDTLCHDGRWFMQSLVWNKSYNFEKTTKIWTNLFF